MGVNRMSQSTSSLVTLSSVVSNSAVGSSIRATKRDSLVSEIVSKALVFVFLFIAVGVILDSSVQAYSGYAVVFQSGTATKLVGCCPPTTTSFDVNWSYRVYPQIFSVYNVQQSVGLSSIDFSQATTARTLAEANATGNCVAEGGTFAWINSWDTDKRNYTCSFNTGTSCSLDGLTIPDGGSIVAFNALTGPPCDSQLRTCTNGNLNGSASYQFKSCGLSSSPTCAQKRLSSSSFNLATVILCLDNSIYNSGASATPSISSVVMNSTSPLTQPELQLQYRVAPHSGSPVFSSWSSSVSPFTVHSSSTSARIEISYCGDGLVQSPEQCDSTADCTVDCKQLCWSDSVRTSRPCLQSGFCQTQGETSPTQCESWGGSAWDGILTSATLECRAQSDGLCSATTIAVLPTSQCVEGIDGSIPDPFINDNGDSGVGDNLEFFCRGGMYRFCLSHEVCPWRGNTVFTGTLDQTCATYPVRISQTPNWMASYIQGRGPWDVNNAYSFNCIPTGGGFGRISYGFSFVDDSPPDTNPGGVLLP
jgi:hypothetical protein